MGHVAMWEDLGPGEDPETQSIQSRTSCAVFVIISLQTLFLHVNGLCHVGTVRGLLVAHRAEASGAWDPPDVCAQSLLILGVLGRWATGCGLKRGRLPRPSLLGSCVPGHPLLASPHITASSRLELPHREVLTSGLS